METKSKPIGKRHIGVASTMLMISQFWFSQQGTRDVKSEIDKLKDDYHLSQLNTEKYFVRKTEFVKVVTKIDKVNLELAKLTEQIKSFSLEASLFNGRQLQPFSNASFFISPRSFKGVNRNGT
jgi:hypothetical protein